MYAKYTRVPVGQSRGEIEKLLARQGCSAFMCGTDYDNGSARVQFKAHGRIVRFVIGLPDKKKFSSGRSGADKYEQAERQKWRALLLVIKAKLESVENGITVFEEEFLAHIVMPNDRTVAELVLPQIAASYQTGKMPKQLEASKET